ncbi:4'-phosphopantetheinyl transferase superfamily protein [bacterium]|jgi:4'-phosphopantetheinyl transferase|uniref:4'-phosphopantetheinyl transferase family protein n=1 Tax=Candidatus Onthocola sp. TaxID=3085646 RepID=UPI0003365B26|nr:4'-phosphopantetheinyl transferase superfamily protein [bacterium]CDE49288.1 4'-phosphopantetheinyl transferase family protein [Firmicutes bacterium CAG:460]
MYKLFTKENTTSKDLLKDVLKNELNITNYELTFNKYNKPYLKNRNIYFNISHDKNTTVLVTSDKEIGVDIEYYTYKESVMKKYYNEFEQQEIINSNNKEYEFTRIWVMKEAFVKMKGQGISYGLQNVDTTRLKKQIKLISNEKYIIAICQSEE